MLFMLHRNFIECLCLLHHHERAFLRKLCASGERNDFNNVLLAWELKDDLKTSFHQLQLPHLGWCERSTFCVFRILFYFRDSLFIAWTAAGVRWFWWDVRRINHWWNLNFLTCDELPHFSGFEMFVAQWERWWWIFFCDIYVLVHVIWVVITGWWDFYFLFS